MSDLETDLREAFPLEEKPPHFSQTGQIAEPSLSQLRDQIKKVMIPLLIKTFQFKLELNQSLSLPSRLQAIKNQRSPDEVMEQLRMLDNDLKVLMLWCQSCQSQIQKALNLPEEEQKNHMSIPATPANPAVAKSFSEAVSAQHSIFQFQTAQEKGAEESVAPPLPMKQKSWWKKLLDRNRKSL